MREMAEQERTAVRTRLGEEAFAQALAEGRMMTSKQILSAQELTTMPTSREAKQAPTPSIRRLSNYPAGLTAREVEVLHLVAQGITDAQVAELLVISPRTVNWYLTSIYSKLGVSSRCAATRYALEHHLA
jgi:DNA-binding NarL/FixJ family response regulator